MNLRNRTASVLRISVRTASVLRISVRTASVLTNISQDS
jgi:hypothetical protein